MRVPQQLVSCPTCKEPLEEEDRSFRCKEDHVYTVVGLALTTNMAAVNALWLAIRALEDDVVTLHYMAAKHGDAYGLTAQARRQEADAAHEAAAMLRGHAKRAQQRLDSLPSAPSSVVESGSQRGRGG